MGRRVIPAVVAVVLFLVAAALVASYVVNADKRASAELEPTPVLVVTQPIPEGEAAVLGTNVELRELPLTAIPPDAVSDIEDLDDRVASTDLLVGEQVLESRFISPESVTGDDVEVPEELAQVTIALDAQRTLGSRLKAGDTVGVNISYIVRHVGVPGEFVREDEDDSTYAITDAILHKVLVTRVQTGVVAEEGQVEAIAEAPLITLAVSAQDAQRVIWAAEYGTIWLSLERETTDVEGTTPIIPENVGSRPLAETLGES
ncbi:hypothetical protein LKO27_12020 [Tessaracoccus sp. OS52]|uniref:Flp pilus assembly protein CpaB n=1 Tax=Tessaracoccus sp. OS52 TaxID=2886691 RepID=UPI001D11A72C|nr:RcpC/CpaB family pilus assembly protein [Tessaracoccus sp. OS52]MCC2594133.1 hypothetical protein [Tessaracoccus sp. OS52]